MATGQQAEPQIAKLMDPVCGLRVDAATAAGRSEYGGRLFYFHSTACKAEFDADPARFAGESSDAPRDSRGDPPGRH